MTTTEKSVVLMVDDDPDIINAGRLKFEEIHGLDFRPARTVDEAIAIIKATEGTIVIFVDVHLGTTTGLKLMRWCQQHVSHRVTVYGITADRDSGVRLTALRAGAITIFYKNVFGNIMEFMDVLVDHAEVSVVKGALQREWLDPLTGFWNIGGFRRQVLPQLEVARLRESHEGVVERRDEKHFGQFSLLFVEVEATKELAESEDPSLGDKMFATFSNIVKANVWPTDQLCRFGGNNFLVFLPDAPESRALEITDAIRQAAKEVKVGDSGTVPRIKIGSSHVDREDLREEPFLDLELLITKARKARR